MPDGKDQCFSGKSLRLNVDLVVHNIRAIGQFERDYALTLSHFFTQKLEYIDVIRAELQHAD